MATVQWDFLHGSIVDDLAHAGRGGIDKRSLGEDHHFIRGWANGQLNISCESGRHIEFEIRNHRSLKTGSADFDAINSDRQGREKIGPGGVGLGCRCDSGSLIGYHHLGVRNHRSGCVRHRAAQRRARLRQRRATEGRQEHDQQEEAQEVFPSKR